MSEWIEYTGIDSYEALKAAKHGFLLKGHYFEGIIKYTINSDKVFYLADLERLKMEVTDYLICQPHPYADLIKIWADTGCPVYAQHKATGQSFALRNAQRIAWNSGEWEFSLTPFEEKS